MGSWDGLLCFMGGSLAFKEYGAAAQMPLAVITHLWEIAAARLESIRASGVKGTAARLKGRIGNGSGDRVKGCSPFPAGGK